MYKKLKIKQLRNKILKLHELKQDYLEKYSSEIPKQQKPIQSTHILSESEIPKSESLEKSCRICYENHNLSKNALLYPCKCKGTIKWVHHECLIKWIQISQNQICPQCQYKYEIHKRNINHPLIFLKNLKFLRIASVFLCMIGVYLSGKICLFLDYLLGIYHFNFQFFYIDIEYLYSSLETLTIISLVLFPLLSSKFPVFKNILERAVGNVYSINSVFSILKLYYYIILESLKELGDYVIPEQEITIIENYPNKIH